MTRAAESTTPDIDVVAINDPGLSAPYMAYLLQHDSVMGRFGGEVLAAGDDLLLINGRPVVVSRESDPAAVPWSEAGAEYVVDASGKFLTAETAGAHLGDAARGSRTATTTTTCDISGFTTSTTTTTTTSTTSGGHGGRDGGVKKVIVTAPTKDTPMYVVGVNEHRYSSDGYPDVVSNASCTTNCLAPLAKIINDIFGLKEGLMTTVHALTVSQPPVDGHSAKDWRRGRSGLLNIVPTTTGAAKAVGRVLPELDGRLTGFALRVPIADVSAVDLTCNLERPATLDAIKAAVKHAAEGAMKGIVAYTEDPVVSQDFIQHPASCIFDASASVQLTPTFVKLMAWYDNEWGYSCRVVDLITHMAKMDRTKTLSRATTTASTTTASTTTAA